MAVLDSDNDQGNLAGGHYPLIHGFGATPNQDMYIRALTAAYRWNFRVHNPSYGLSRDADAYEVVMRDPIVRQLVDGRVRSAAGRVHRWVAGDDTPEAETKRQIVEAWADRISSKLESFYQLAVAIIRGSSFGYGCAKRKLTTIGGVTAPWWVCHKIEDIDLRRFRWVNATTQAPYPTTAGVVEPGGRQLQIWRATGPEPGWVPVPRDWPLIRIVYNDDESRLGYGRGLLDALYHNVWMKQELLALIMEGMETWTRGIIYAKIDGLRASSQSNATIKSSTMTEMVKMLSNGVLIGDLVDEFGALQNGTGLQQAMAVVAYFDDSSRALISGAVLPSGGGGTGRGSLSRAQVESQKEEYTVQYDRQKLGEDIGRQLVWMCTHYNAPIFRMLGLDTVPDPALVIVQEPRVDPMTKVQIAAQMTAMGYPILPRDIYDQTGFTRPPGINVPTPPPETDDSGA